MQANGFLSLTMSPGFVKTLKKEKKLKPIIWNISGFIMNYRFYLVDNNHCHRKFKKLLHNFAVTLTETLYYSLSFAFY